jgi:hypothetical protein
MGNTQAQPVNVSQVDASKTVSNRNMHQSDEGQLRVVVDRINKLSRALYQMYGLNFNNNKFCQNIALTYEKKLGELSLTQLQGINKKMEETSSSSQGRRMKAYLTYNPKSGEKFLVNEIRGNLVDFFTDKKVDFKSIDEIGTDVMGVSYINPKTLSSLKPYNVQNRDFTPKDTNTRRNQYPPRQFRGKNRRFQKGIQRGGDNINKMLADLPSTLAERPPKPNNDKMNEMDDIGNIGNKGRGNDNKINKNYTSLNKRNNKNISKREEILPRKEYVQESKPEPKKTYLNELSEVQDLIKSNSKSNSKNVSGANLEKVNAEIKTEFKEIEQKEKEILSNINQRQVETKDVLQKAENSQVKVPTFENQVPNQKLGCNSVSEDCYLTKDELCQRIAKHYTYRGNIIAAILSTIPYKEKETNQLKGSFCYNRYKALREGKMCLPPGIEELDGLSLQEKLQRLVKFINQMDDNQCQSVRGRYKILNSTEKQAMITNDNKFNRYYILYTAKLYNQYLEDLQKLLSILEVLEGSSSINNLQLNQIGEQTKNILDSMYSKCQFNYLSALLAYIRADLDITQKSRKTQDIEVQELEKGLGV